MNTLPDLIQFILRHDHVIVFGNLGRYPKILFDVLASDPQLNVTIVSPYYLCESTPDNRIRVVNPKQSVDSCDLHVVMEPTPYQLVEKPPKAARMAVFTSHFTYNSGPETVWTNVCYFHTDTPDVMDRVKCTQDLLKLQDHSIQTQNVNQVFVEAMHRLIIRGRKDSPIDTSDTYVLVDLTQYKTPFVMYLAFLDAFDYMIDNTDRVSRWVVCFQPKDGRKAFDQFTQNCLDKLFCKRIEHGNVTDMGKILALLPFYKSGSIDRTFPIPTFRFLDTEYVSPSTPSEACKAATMYNLDHWVGNIYRIKD
ncbi:hypothetical protein AVEN_261818-1 [Araneus ventricosus]|uniref:Uncharacterized protein n=1 Tax=Araneus ventricosus TaxID=182803 RepID=A0A4Y2LY50_ARAVE|nr:hypothetical protein AVEN_261818-1 [Araneus ventricosus]